MSTIGNANVADQWVERSGALMAWAVTADERKATYIGNLRREQTGLACACVCPACGGQLQAVNAGKSLQELPIGKSLRPHFRHHTGQQQDACLVRMSQLVALQLLVQEKVIHLPSQTTRWTVGGASGQIYTGTATSAGFAARIVDRQWVDEHEAKITLENGKVVWLRLFGTYGKGAVPNSDAIVSIKVNDPEVATWPIEKILEHAQLTGEWLCFEKHWEDNELQQQARQDAEQQAQHWCDHIPQDLDLPEGLTHAQRSEGVLHWLIKGILENAKQLVTPEYRDTLIRYMPDQKEVSRRIHLEGRAYRITNVRLENRLQGVIPDVICTASHGPITLELMVEVAVTHKVDQAKLTRIRDMGMACLEIDAQRLGKGGRTTVDELRSMVLSQTRNKIWLYHPDIEMQRRAAEDYLSQIYVQRVKEIAEEREQTAWLQTLDDESLLQEYMHLLRQVWTNPNPRSSKGKICLPSELVPFLEKRNFRGMDLSAIVVPHGLLWMVDAIVYNNQRMSAVAIFEEALTGSGPVPLKTYVTVLGAAIVMYEASMTTDEAERMQAMREIVKQSLQTGEVTYARTTQYDRVLTILYPRLKERLQSNKGTHEVAMKVRLQRHIQQRDQEQKVQEAERLAKAEKDNQDELRARFNEVNLFYGWLPKAGWPHDLPTTQMHVKQSIGRNDVINGLQWKSTLETAWLARENGKSLHEWLQSEGVKHVHDINVRLRLLEVAWMLDKRKAPRTQ